MFIVDHRSVAEVVYGGRWPFVTRIDPFVTACYEAGSPQTAITAAETGSPESKGAFPSRAKRSPWPRLRKEFPEKYESYVDLQPGVWTRLRIDVAGTTARLFVHGNTQPNLIVDDLKHGRSEGGVALWIGAGSEAFFSTLRITPR